MVLITAVSSAAATNNNVERVRKVPATNSSKICNSKICKAEGCLRRVRSGGSYCISHGGGNTCEHPGCSTSARHGSMFCIAHGGGRRCRQPGCTKSAVGSTKFCKAHGGGRRCCFPGCFCAARPGQPQMCMKHGGGKRCALGTCRRSTVSRSNFCGEHRLIDGDSDEKNKPGQTGQAEDVRKKGNIIGTDKSSQDLPRASTKPRFTATELTVPPLNTSLEDFRNAEDLRPPLLFTIDESDMMSCDTSDDEDACDKISHEGASMSSTLSPSSFTMGYE